MATRWMVVSMDWTVYWFMLPVCVVVASVAMFSGISGAALLTPVFLIGFPLLGVPRLSTVAAIGTALLLETSGFGAGVARYLSLRLLDTRTAWSIVAVTLPAGAAGAVAAAQAPAQALRIGYGILMIGLAAVLAGKAPGRPADDPATSPSLVSTSDRSHPPCGAGDCAGQRADGRRPRLAAARPRRAPDRRYADVAPVAVSVQ